MKEGFKLEGPGKPCDVSEYFIELESPEICEAMQIVCSAGYMIMMEVCDFNARKARLKEQLEEHSNAPTSGSPALKEAASQFNDALLDEQGKKIKHLTKKITRLNKIIHKKNMKIEELRKEGSRFLRGKIKMFGENMDLEQELKDKDAVLADVAEELRLTKIREKNLAELGLKYVGENEKLKKKLADKIVDEIDARALKSAESALAYKEKVIAEKDEVIDKLTKENNDYKKVVEEFRNKIADMTIGKIEIQNIRLKEKDEVIADLGNELAEAKKLNTAKILDINAKCMRAARESINDVFESYAAKYAKSTLDELKDKAYESFNAKAHKLGLVGSKDGKGLLNQMAGVDAAEEGADQSGKIVICGKDFGKLLKENEESAEELSKVLNDVIDQFLLFGEIIIKSEK